MPNLKLVAEERESEDGDGVGGFLHPDYAYMGGSRRGSSQSENLDVTEPHQMAQDLSRSLPGSRRSSFQKEGEKQGKFDLSTESIVFHVT